MVYLKKILRELLTMFLHHLYNRGQSDLTIVTNIVTTYRRQKYNCQVTPVEASWLQLSCHWPTPFLHFNKDQTSVDSLPSLSPRPPLWGGGGRGQGGEGQAAGRGQEGSLLAARREANSCSLVVGLVEELLKGGWEELAAVGQEGGSSLYCVVVLVVQLLAGGRKIRLLGTNFCLALASIM